MFTSGITKPKAMKSIMTCSFPICYAGILPIQSDCIQQPALFAENGKFLNEHELKIEFSAVHKILALTSAANCLQNRTNFYERM